MVFAEAHTGELDEDIMGTIVLAFLKSLRVMQFLLGCFIILSWPGQGRNSFDGFHLNLPSITFFDPQNMKSV